MDGNQNSTAVLHIVSSLEVGGAERFVIDLCQVQRNKGANVAILSFGQSSDPLVKECENGEIEVFHTQSGKLNKWRSAYKALKIFDVIHFHSPYPLKFLLPVLLFCRSKKIVYTRHGADPLAGSTWRWTHKIARYFVDQMSFVSKEGAQVFERSHGWHNMTKHVIDNGVNLTEFQPEKTQFTGLRLGSVGRMVSLKNQISLLRAVARLAPETQKAIEIHFFGDGPCLNELQQFSEEQLRSSNIVFHGMVANRNTIYNSFDVMVVTSETEGLSLAIIEAMAYYCPVIATKVGGNPKLVEHQRNGLLFEYNDDETLASLIKTILDDKAVIEQYGAVGRQKIERQFSLSACADKYNQLYID
ncbi:glycosyltransferase family 1 protein [Thalassotalea insulae]|uniref:Glycosyltransferase family 1 protein n=1 Tax=Thalassotalea insulae TaxID=2056778 RepID=A0ABQ6GQI2_9GAMM|nr:glycosyltransferase family 4 protein [Thalassotalea insulae]GLX78192.1 glycosyltransferase family 1 protein [Thalassotalea insulae]